MRAQPLIYFNAASPVLKPGGHLFFIICVILFQPVLLLLVLQYVVVRSGCVDLSITCKGVVSGAAASCVCGASGVGDVVVLCLQLSVAVVVVVTSDAVVAVPNAHCQQCCISFCVVLIQSGLTELEDAFVVFRCVSSLYL